MGPDWTHWNGAVDTIMIKLGAMLYDLEMRRKAKHLEQKQKVRRALKSSSPPRKVPQGLPPPLLLDTTGGQSLGQVLLDQHEHDHYRHGSQHGAGHDAVPDQVLGPEQGFES